MYALKASPWVGADFARTPKDDKDLQGRQTCHSLRVLGVLAVLWVLEEAWSSFDRHRKTFLYSPHGRACPQDAGRPGAGAHSQRRSLPLWIAMAARPPAQWRNGRAGYPADPRGPSRSGAWRPGDTERSTWRLVRSAGLPLSAALRIPGRRAGVVGREDAVGNPGPPASLPGYRDHSRGPRQESPPSQLRRPEGGRPSLPDHRDRLARRRRGAGQRLCEEGRDLPAGRNPGVPHPRHADPENAGPSRSDRLPAGNRWTVSKDRARCRRAAALRSYRLPLRCGERREDPSGFWTPRSARVRWTFRRSGPAGPRSKPGEPPKSAPRSPRSSWPGSARSWSGSRNHNDDRTRRISARSSAGHRRQPARAAFVESDVWSNRRLRTKVF